jgi:hypothetical protein
MNPGGASYRPERVLARGRRILTPLALTAATSSPDRKRASPLQRSGGTSQGHYPQAHLFPTRDRWPSSLALQGASSPPARRGRTLHRPARPPSRHLQLGHPACTRPTSHHRRRPPLHPLAAAVAPTPWTQSRPVNVARAARTAAASTTAGSAQKPQPPPISPPRT